jgi:hypothetical protein
MNQGGVIKRHRVLTANSVSATCQTFKAYIMTKPAFKSSVVSNAVHSVGSTNQAAPSVCEVKAIIAYPSLSTPDPKSGDKYTALLLIKDPEDQQALIDLVGDACAQTFRSRELPPGAHNPLRDSNERNLAGEFAFKHPVFRTPSGMVVRAKTGYPPVCVWGPNESEIASDEINGGDEVVVQLSAYGYSNQSQGVGLSLGRVWLIEKGITKIERGSGATANVRRIDRSRLRFNDGTGEAA